MSFFGRAEFLKALLGASPPPSPAASRPTSPGRAATLSLNAKGGPALSVTVVEGAPPQRALAEFDPDDIHFTADFNRIFAPVWQGSQSNWVCLDFAATGEQLGVVAQKLVDPTKGEWVRSETTEKAFCVTALQDGFDAALVGLFDKARRRDGAVLSAMRMAWGTEPPVVGGRAVRPPPALKATGASIWLHAGSGDAAVALDAAAADPALQDGTPRAADLSAALAVERQRYGRLLADMEDLRARYDKARVESVAGAPHSAELAGAKAALEVAQATAERLTGDAKLLEQQYEVESARAAAAEADCLAARTEMGKLSEQLNEARAERREAEANARTLALENKALKERCAAAAVVSPVQLEAAGRRVRDAETRCAQLQEAAIRDAIRFGQEQTRRVSAEREMEKARQQVRELQTQVDRLESAAPAEPLRVHELQREVDELRARLNASLSRGDVSPAPDEPDVCPRPAGRELSPSQVAARDKVTSEKEAERLHGWKELCTRLDGLRATKVLPAPTTTLDAHCYDPTEIDTARLLKRFFPDLESERISAFLLGSAQLTVKGCPRNILGAQALHLYFSKYKRVYGRAEMNIFVSAAQVSKPSDEVSLELVNLWRSCWKPPHQAVDSGRDVSAQLLISGELFQEQWQWDLGGGDVFPQKRENAMQYFLQESACVFSTFATLGGVPKTAWTSASWPEQVVPKKTLPGVPPAFITLPMVSPDGAPIFVRKRVIWEFDTKVVS